jgi:hypothetical protein
MAKAIVNDKGEVYINCPGCGHCHSLATITPNHCGARWTWNNSLDSPSFSPSLNVSWYFTKQGVRVDGRCHSFIRDGKIQFLNDCTHSLAGQTVDLPDWDSDA